MMVSKKQLRANWTEFIGIPGPDAGPWMLRDTPLTRRGLELLRPKARSLTSEVAYVDGGAKHVMGTATKAETVQHRYETAGRSVEQSVLGTLADVAPVSLDVVEAFAARPESDLYVVNVVFDDVAVAAPVSDGVERVQDELGLDVQVVTLDATDADAVEYPGSVIPVDVEDLTNMSSAVARAIPSADIMTLQAGPEFADAAADLIATAEPGYRLINSNSGTFVGRAREFLLQEGDGVAVGPRPPRDRPAHPAQRMLSHFDPTVLVDDEVRLDPGEDGDGQTTLDALPGSASG